MSPVEVMTSVKRRRRWSAAQKRAMVEEAVVPLPEVRELKTKVCEPERILGKKTMEVEILKDAIEIAREEKLIVRMPIPPHLHVSPIRKACRIPEETHPS